VACLYVVEQGAVLGREGHKLVVRKGQEVLQELPLQHVECVYIYGQVQVTTALVHSLVALGSELVFLTADGRYCGRLLGRESSRADLRLLQYRRAEDESWRLAMAKQIVAAKLHNQRALLLRFSREYGLDGPGLVAERMKFFLGRAERSTKQSALMGIEGSGTALYFQGLRALLPPELGFTRRVRRPPTDPANVLLSLGYTLLGCLAESAVAAAGLDPYVGFLHSLAYGRASLALDLMEEFRPLVVDSLVVRLLRRGEICAGDFCPGAGEQPIRLGSEGLKKFLRAFSARMETSLRHPVTGTQATYRRCLLLQAEEIRRTLADDKPLYRAVLAR
jgi:CRISPR-associated protein Cas1